MTQEQFVTSVNRSPAARIRSRSPGSYTVRVVSGQSAIPTPAYASHNGTYCCVAVAEQTYERNELGPAQPARWAANDPLIDDRTTGQGAHRRHNVS
jgi:hypothetical protein